MTAAAVPVPVGPPATGVPQVAPEVVAPELVVAELDDDATPEDEELELELDAGLPLLELDAGAELELETGPEVGFDVEPALELEVGAELVPELETGPEVGFDVDPALELEVAPMLVVGPPPAPPAAVVEVETEPELDAGVPLVVPTVDAVLAPVPNVPLLDSGPVCVVDDPPPTGAPLPPPTVEVLPSHPAASTVLRSAKWDTARNAGLVRGEMAAIVLFPSEPARRCSRLLCIVSDS